MDSIRNSLRVSSRNSLDSGDSSRDSFGIPLAIHLEIRSENSLENPPGMPAKMLNDMSLVFRYKLLLGFLWIFLLEFSRMIY